MHGHGLFESGYCTYHHLKDKCKSVAVHSMKGTSTATPFFISAPYERQLLNSTPAAKRTLELAEKPLCILAHSVLMCVTALTSINWLVFVVQTDRVAIFAEVGTERTNINI